MDQPTQALTWAELQTVAFGFVVANASQTQPIAGGTLGAAVAPALAFDRVAWLHDAALAAMVAGPSLDGLP